MTLLFYGLVSLFVAAFFYQEQKYSAVKFFSILSIACMILSLLELFL